MNKFQQLMLLLGTMLLFLYGTIASANSAPQPILPLATIRNMIADQSTIGRYEKFQAQLDVSAQFTNPYDPDDIRIDVSFSAPSGRIQTVPAFYARDFNLEIEASKEVLTPAAKVGWWVRFTPDEIGTWIYRAQIKTRAMPQPSTGPTQTFSVTPSTQHGFLHISKRDPHYLDFDDGQPFFGVGMNMGWYSETGHMADYEQWTKVFSAAGGNIIRVWMAAWSFGLEWKDTGLGNYDQRQDRASELDKLFDMADQRGLYIMLTLINHGQFNTKTNPEWKDNPYNAQNGGPLQSPEEFASNPQAIRLWQQRLRYIAARWGYSTHLMAWEWWNEINWTPLANPDILAPWIAQSAAYLKTVDPYAHLITHSGSSIGDDKIWGDPTISFTQAHTYDAIDWGYQLGNDTKKWIKTYQKPFLLGEYGYSDGAPSFDPLAIRLHIGLWDTAMNGSFGTGQFWWWDTYIHALNLYSQFTAISNFFSGEDLPAHHYDLAQAKLKPTTSGYVFGLQNHNGALLWILADAYNDTSYLHAVEKNIAAKVKDPNQVIFPDETGVILTVKGLDDGDYILEWWNTHTGKITSTDKGTSGTGELKILVPTFQSDLALKIRRSD